MNQTWTAVIPIKAWATSKTRLDGSADARAEFARAAALDTLDLVAASRLIGRIVVVSAEPEIAELTATIGSAVVLDEPAGETSDQLNNAIRAARDWAIRNAPTSPVVVIPTDLAALTTPILEEALGQLAWLDQAHVPDHRGRGTTLAAATRPSLLVPCYGVGSQRAHAAAGSTPIVGVAPGVRLDVDNIEDLADARSLGLGLRTRATRAADGIEESRPGSACPG